MRGRQVFMESLVNFGIDHIFGNPGTTESPLLDSLADYPSINYIVSLQESLAVSAASFYARASGKTSVANMHVAPGLGNAIGMMYGALKAEAPVIITAGQQDTRMRLREPVLYHDLVAMAAPVCKWAVQVESADEMASVVHRAFKIANDPPCGPVFISLPINVMEQETSNLPFIGESLFRTILPDPSGVDAIASMALSSSNPVIIAGDGIARQGGFDQVVTLAETLGAAVFSELLVQEISFPTSHHLYRGRLSIDAAATRELLKEHDFILVIGSTFIEEVWFSEGKPYGDDVKLAQIESSYERLAHKLELNVGVVGSIPETLDTLTSALNSRLTDESRVLINERNNQLGLVKQQAKNMIETNLKACWDRSPMSATRAMFELNKALPEDVVIVDETLTAMGDVATNFKFDHPGSYYGGKGGGIGQGLAGVIGVKLANNDKAVVAISGDGSAMYSIQALWTAAHHDLDIIFVILSNREYRILKINLDEYRQRYEAESEKPYPHMDLENPSLRFVEMGQGMGVPGEEVTNPEAIASAIEAGLSTKGPYIIDVVIESKQSFI